MTYKHTSTQSGFTLVEMLVALVLLSMISLIGYQGVVFGIAQWRKGESRLTAVVDGFQAEQWLRQRLSAAERISYAHKGITPIAFSGNRGSVRFVTRFGKVRQAGLYVCEIYRNGNELSVKYGLYHPENGSFAGMKTMSRAVLMESIRKVEFRYYGRNQKGVRAWRSNWQQQNRLPEMVGVEVTSATGEKNESIVYVETADSV